VEKPAEDASESESDAEEKPAEDASESESDAEEKPAEDASESESDAEEPAEDASESESDAEEKPAEDASESESDGEETPDDADASDSESDVEVKAEEKALVEKAKEIADMPEGDEKEEAEKEVIEAAEELGKKNPTHDSNSDSEPDAEDSPEQKQIASVAAKVLDTEQSVVDHNREAIAQMPDGDVKAAAEQGLAVQDKAVTSLKELLRNKDNTAVDPDVLGRVGRAEKQQAEAKIQLALAMKRDDGVKQARAEYEEASRVAAAAKLSMLSPDQVQHVSGVLDNFAQKGPSAGCTSGCSPDAAIDQDVVQKQVSAEVEVAQLAMQKAQARFESSVAQIKELDQEDDQANP
jgi:hypothetical protein